METTKIQVVCNLKAARKAKGISQSDLAARVGVKRQAIYDMETGRYVPNTTIALRMARVLGCKVEDLFSLDDTEDAQPVTLVEQAGLVNERVSVARVRDQLVAYPSDGKWLQSDGFIPADGLLAPGGSLVQLLHGKDRLEKKVLLLGCDPAFAILSAHASRWAADATVQCRFASSHLAMERLAKGHAHIAGTHLHNNAPGESNLALARKMLRGTKAVVIAFSRFEEGLMVAPGNPLNIRSVVDLYEKKARFVNREVGAALRVLFEERLAEVGLTGDAIQGYRQLASSHAQCAQMVAYGMADAAMGLRAVAAAHGLDFVPMEAVRCDLVIPVDMMAHPAVRILLDALQTGALRRELAALPGYESACTGSMIGEV